MHLRNLMLAGLLLSAVTITTRHGFAQSTPLPPALIYNLLKGSQLLDECPVCARPSIAVPMSGTFQLQLLGSDPLFTRYALTNIAFQAGSPSGPQYQVVGNGTYQVGGEVAVVQDLFLTVQVDNGFTNRLCYFTNAVGTVTSPWPQIQVKVDQTNGTFVQVYHLQLLAAPALQFVSGVADVRSGNVRLDWQGNTNLIQLERATNAAGPYWPIASNLTAQSFVDVGALTNRAQSYYRLVPQ